ncbi:hypothetical protein BH20PSE1_BH20PSE1_01310 [soil metagenome]
MSARRWPAQALLELEPGHAKVKRLPPTPEADIVGPLKKLLGLHKGVCWAMRANTGSGFLVDYRTMQAIIEALGGVQAFEARFGRPRWMEFGTPGCSDFVGQLKDGRTLALEAKAGRYSPGAVTDSQRSFLALVSAHGGLAFVGSDLARIECLLSGKADPEPSEHGYMV